MEKWHEYHLLRKLQKDAIAEARWNKKALKRLYTAGYISFLGVSQKGRAKGKKCFMLDIPGYERLERLTAERKETRRFHLSLWVPVATAIIGLLLGAILVSPSP